MLCIRVSPRLRRDLKLLAARSGRSMQVIVADALAAVCRQIAGEGILDVLRDVAVSERELVPSVRAALEAALEATHQSPDDNAANGPTSRSAR